MITKIYAFDAGKFAPLFRPNNNAKNSARINTFHNISFKSNASQSNEPKKTCDAPKSPIETMPHIITSAYMSAKDMLERLPNFTKRALKTNTEAQNSAAKIKNKAEHEFLYHRIEYGTPKNASIKIESINEDGTKDIIHFKKGVLGSYYLGTTRRNGKVYTDKVFAFENGNLKEYMENLITAPENEGKDVKFSKSIEYEGISAVYKEGCEKSAEGVEKTDTLACLILGKPWYFEEGITEDKKERVKRISKRVEFSNEEKTTYSYLEDSIFSADTKFSKQSLYVENSIPYRYCEEEKFLPNNLGFNSYSFRRIFYFSEGRWRFDTKY